MFIVRGTKIRRVPLGYSLDFCSLCRDARPHNLHRVDGSHHVYWATVTNAKVVGHDIQCSTCGLLRSLGPDDRVNRIPPDWGPEDPESPVPFEVQERVALEHRLLDGALSERERLEMIAEPIAAMDYALAFAQRNGRSEWVISAVGLLCIACVFAAVLVGSAQGWSALTLFLAAAAALLLGFVVLLTVRQPRTVARRIALSRLARSLAVVNPSRAELEEVLSVLRCRRSGCARSLEVSDLLLEIDQHRRGQPVQDV